MTTPFFPSFFGSVFRCFLFFVLVLPSLLLSELFLCFFPLCCAPRIARNGVLRRILTHGVPKERIVGHAEVNDSSTIGSA